MDRDKQKYILYKDKYLRLKNEARKIRGGDYAIRNPTFTPYQIDEIHFWGRQLTEHCLLLHLGMVDESLQQKGKDLFSRWETFMIDNFYSKGVDGEKIVLENSDFLKIDKIDENIWVLIDDLRQYKLEIIRRLKNGQWLGWIWITFADHLLEELEHFEKKIKGIVIPKTEEIDFYNDMNSDHAALTAHYLDPIPKNQNLIQESMDYSHRKLELNAKDKAYLQLSIDFAKELDDFSLRLKNLMVKKQLDSIIHPVFIEHDIREGRRSIYMLNLLKNN